MEQSGSVYSLLKECQNFLIPEREGVSCKKTRDDENFCFILYKYFGRCQRSETEQREELENCINRAREGRRSFWKKKIEKESGKKVYMKRMIEERASNFRGTNQIMRKKNRLLSLSNHRMHIKAAVFEKRPYTSYVLTFPFAQVGLISSSRINISPGLKALYAQLIGQDTKPFFFVKILTLFKQL